MYYFYGKINREHVDCPSYGGCPYVGEFVMGGSTVVIQACTGKEASILLEAPPSHSFAHNIGPLFIYSLTNYKSMF